MADSTLDLDFDRVTPRMLIDFKEKSGRSLMAMFEDGDLDPSKLDEVTVAALIWIVMRMDRPDATWDEALDAPFNSLSFAKAELDPTNAGNAS